MTSSHQCNPWRLKILFSRLQRTVHKTFLYMQHTVSREMSFKDPSAPFFNVIHEMDQDLKKLPSYCPGQVHADFHSGQTIMFSFSLAQWARDQASHLPWTKSLKEQTTWFAQGKQNLRRYLSQGQAGIQVFFEPYQEWLDYHFWKKRNSGKK